MRFTLCIWAHTELLHLYYCTLFHRYTCIHSLTSIVTWQLLTMVLFEIRKRPGGVWCYFFFPAVNINASPYCILAELVQFIILIFILELLRGIYGCSFSNTHLHNIYYYYYFQGSKVLIAFNLGLVFENQIHNNLLKFNML